MQALRDADGPRAVYEPQLHPMPQMPAPALTDSARSSNRPARPRPDRRVACQQMIEPPLHAACRNHHTGVSIRALRALLNHRASCDDEQAAVLLNRREGLPGLDD